MRAALLLLVLTLAAHAQKGPEAFGDELGAWLEQRVAAGKAGKREIVRVPFVHRSMGWGCDCPDFFVGTSPDTVSSEKAWVFASPAAGVELPEAGKVAVAEGYFTGATYLEEHDRGGASDAENSYSLWTFRILRTRPHRGEADDFVYVVLAGPEAQKDVPAFSDDKPWMAIAASLPLADKGSAAKAEALRAQLAATGFPAEAFDGRKAPLLFCCYYVVVAGRYATKGEADAAAKAAAAKKFTAYVRKGF